MKLTRIALILTAATFASCSTPAPPETAKSEAAPKPPKDETALFPLEGQTGTHVVADHLLGKPFLPGGTIADYKLADYMLKGATYQLFAIRMPSGDQAAFLLLDFKKNLTDPKYLPHMGGYFGMDGAQPLYVFAKRDVVAGVVGLDQQRADAVARVFAAKIH